MRPLKRYSDHELERIIKKYDASVFSGVDVVEYVAAKIILKQRKGKGERDEG